MAKRFLINLRRFWKCNAGLIPIIAILWLLHQDAFCMEFNTTFDYEYPDEWENSTGRFYIGAVLPDNNAENFFFSFIKTLNFDGVSVCTSCTLYHVSALSSGNPIRDARLVCSKLISKGVFAIVLGGGGNITSAAAAAVSYTGGFYQIPVIGTAARDSAFSNKNIHISFLRTVPPYSHQVDVWVELLKMYKFTQIVFIHSSDTDGRSLLGRLRSYDDSLHDDKGIKISSVLEFTPGEGNVAVKLEPLRESLVRVFLLYATKEDADAILNEADKLNITTEGSIWILTEEALESSYAPEGAIGLRLKSAQNQNAHIADSLSLVSLALRKLRDETPDLIINPPNTCNREEPWNITGKVLFRTIQEQILFNGKTGKVAFDLNGDRKYAEYDIINIQHRVTSSTEGTTEEIIREIVGKYFYHQPSDSMQLAVNSSKMVWGGGSRKIPTGILVPRYIKVLTVEEPPFVYSEEKTDEVSCTDDDESLCIWRDPQTLDEHTRCCYGYCIELLNALATNNNFSFDLHLSSDGHYGEKVITKQGPIWTGVIGELTNQTGGSDMIVAPLTINPERAQAIEFTKPFKYQGITILVKKAHRTTALVSILQPFQFNLWMMLLATVHFIALLIWLLDRLSPMYKRDSSETDSLKISEAFWFSWGVILNSGLGEGTPRCLSSRVMSMIWAGFAMIIVASYTANLAAFLVLEDHGETLSGINDPKLRNPVEDFKFATVKSSAVDTFFRRKTEWANMYRVMENNNCDSVEEAVKAVKNGSLQAFIWDSSRLEYEAAQNCELVTVGELFGRSGYGIGLRKGLFWNDKITLDILEFHESGFLADLDEKWIWEGETECPPDRGNSPQRLGLVNLEGIFIMIVGGVVAGIALILVELAYECYKTRCRSESRDAEGTKGTESELKGVKEKVERSLSSYHCREISSLPDDTDSSLCDFCREKKCEFDHGFCYFCSQIASASDYHDSDGTCSEFYHDINRRLDSSFVIPDRFKYKTAKELVEQKLKLKQMLGNKTQELDQSPSDDASEKYLLYLLNILNENPVNEVTRCKALEFTSHGKEVRLALDKKSSENDTSTDFPISRDITFLKSSPNVQSEDNNFHSLPNVASNTELQRDYEDDCRSECSSRNSVYI